MTNISDGIREIGSAEANLDADAAKERIDAQDVTKAHLEEHKSSVEVANSDVLQKIAAVKGLISQVGENSAETEAVIAQAISEACGGDQAKMEWLAGELGIDISKLETTGTDLFGKDDLAALAQEVEGPEEYFSAAIALLKSLPPDYQGTVDAIVNRLNPDVYSLEERMETMVDGLKAIEEHLAAQKDSLEGMAQSPDKELLKRDIAQVDKFFTDILAAAPAATTTTRPGTQAETAPDAVETAETDKANVYAVLAKVLRVDSQEPAAIKAKLVEALSNVDNVGQFLDQLVSSIKSVEGIPGLTDGTVEALMNRTGLNVAIAALKTEFGDTKLTAEQASQVADKLMSGAAEIQAAQENTKPFEVTPLSAEQLASRATDVASFPGVANSPTEALQASKVAQFLTESLDKAITDKDLPSLQALGRVLGLVINETDVDKLIGHINENRAAIDERITKLSQAVDGKSQADIQAAAAEANRQNVDALLSAAAKEFPEHVGTQRWNNWVNKLANGETQKSFAEYLAEDEPVQGLEAIFLMLKKFIMQFKDLMSGINPKEGEQTLSQKLQEEVDKARGIINDAHLERVGKALGMTAEEVQANADGLDSFNENKDLFDKNPNVNILGMDIDGDGTITDAEKIKTLQSMSPEQRTQLMTLLRSVDERPFMKEVLAAGLDAPTIDAIYDFKANMEAKGQTGTIEINEGDLVINGESLELKAGNDETIISVIRKHLEDEDGVITEEETAEHSAKFEILERLKTAGRIDESITESDIPEGMMDGNDLESTFENFFGISDSFWKGYKLSLEDINKFIKHRDRDTFDSGHTFEANGDDKTFDVDGTWKWLSWGDENFESVEDFLAWLDHPDNNEE